MANNLSYHVLLNSYVIGEVRQEAGGRRQEAGGRRQEEKEAWSLKVYYY
jgi:hypothetical protein